VRAQRVGDLNSRDAYAARGARDQGALTIMKIALANQCVVRGRKRFGKSSGFLPRHVVWKKK